MTQPPALVAEWACAPQTEHYGIKSIKQSRRVYSAGSTENHKHRPKTFKTNGRPRTAHPITQSTRFVTCEYGFPAPEDKSRGPGYRPMSQQQRQRILQSDFQSELLTVSVEQESSRIARRKVRPTSFRSFEDVFLEERAIRPPSVERVPADSVVHAVYSRRSRRSQHRHHNDSKILPSIYQHYSSAPSNLLGGGTWTHLSLDKLANSSEYVSRDKSKLTQRKKVPLKRQQMGSPSTRSPGGTHQVSNNNNSIENMRNVGVLDHRKGSRLGSNSYKPSWSKMSGSRIRTANELSQSFSESITLRHFDEMHSESFLRREGGSRPGARSSTRHANSRRERIGSIRNVPPNSMFYNSSFGTQNGATESKGGVFSRFGFRSRMARKRAQAVLSTQELEEEINMVRQLQS